MAYTLTDPGRTLRRRHRAPDRTPWVLGLAAAAGVVAAVLSDAAPVGWTPVDVAYRAIAAAAVTVAASRSRRWTLVWAAAVVTVFAGSWAALPAAAALGTAVWLLATDERERVVRAAVGAVVAVVALRLRWPVATLASAAVAAAALLPVVFSGVRRLRRRERTVVWSVLGAGAVLVLAGAAGAAAFAAAAVPRVTEGVRLANAAVAGLGSEDAAAVRDRFDAATAEFDAVRRAGDAWWVAPARAVPVLAPHVRLARDAARSGTELGSVAAEVSAQVTDERLRRPDGGVDLGRLAALAGPADRARDTLEVVEARLAGARSPWILPPVTARVDEVDEKVASARSTAELASVAARTAPRMLGAEGERRYLFLLGNPAEARDLGGHIGNWAEVVVAAGKVDVRRVGQPYDLSGPGTSPRPRLTAGAYPQSLLELRPELFPQNWGGSPDLPTVARLAAEMWGQVHRGERVDGVAYADPAAFAALLRFTGPVVEPTTGTRLTPENAEEFLTRTQFATLKQTGQGGDPLGDVIQDALRRFTSSQLPAPDELGRVLGPVVTGGHLQLASLDPADAELLERTGLLGSVERPGAGDLLAVLNRNANPSKIDAYLRRSVDYQVAWNVTTGETRGVLDVTLRNTASASGLPDVVAAGPPGLPPGTNRTQLCVLSPLGVRSAYLDDERTGVGTQQELRGVLRHCLFVDIGAGATRRVRLNLLGTLGAAVPYEMRWVGQPLLGEDRARVTVSADGTTVDGGRASTTVRLPSGEDAEVRVAPDTYPPQPSS